MQKHLIMEEKMRFIEFKVDKPLLYNFTGKFVAPSPNWMHSDDFLLTDYELIVVTEEPLYLSYAGQNYTVPPKSFLLLPPRPPPYNSRKGFKPSACSFYWLHFETDHPLSLKNILPDEKASYMSALSADSISLPRQGRLLNFERVIVMMKQLQDAVRNGYNPQFLNYMTTLILCEIYNQDRCVTPEVSSGKKTQKQIYYDIMDYIKTNISESLKVSDIAAHFGYNEKYISSLFSSHAGTTLKQYIMNTKIDLANFYLSDTNEPVVQIARTLGFKDSHNFATAYKKIMGVTPSEYRNAFAKRMLYHV